MSTSTAAATAATATASVTNGRINMLMVCRLPMPKSTITWELLTRFDLKISFIFRIFVVVFNFRSYPEFGVSGSLHFGVANFAHER